MQVVVLHNQSLLDLALQHTGTIESIFELAMLNNLSITDDVVAGKVLTIPRKEDKACNCFYARGQNNKRTPGRY